MSNFPLKDFWIAIGKDIQWFLAQPFTKIAAIVFLGVSVVVVIATYLYFFSLLLNNYLRASLWTTMFFMVLHWGGVIWLFNTYLRTYTESRGMVKRVKKNET